MYSVKGGWIGQTFALASCNGSGGKKSRTRRSKEERKALVETFIKKYQGLNDGKFPSLNLTHKEVGGSFYTVREIVRDIIQENRVLGPSKSSSAEQKIYDNSARVPLESVSTESQEHLFQLAISLDAKEDAVMGLDSSDNKQHANVTDQVAGLYPNGIQSGDSDKDIFTESSESEGVCLGIFTDHLEKTDQESNLTDNSSALHENIDVLHRVNWNQLGVSDEGEQSELSESESIEAYKEVYMNGANANNKECVDVEKKLNGYGQCDEPEGLCNGHQNRIVESDKVVSIDSPVSGQIDVKKEPELVGANSFKISSPTAEVMVETFPLRYVSKGTLTSDVVSDNKLASNGCPKKLEMYGFGLDNDSAALERASLFVNPSESVKQKAEGASEVSLSDGQCDVSMAMENMAKAEVANREVLQPAAIIEARGIGDKNECSPDPNCRMANDPTEELVSKRLAMTATMDDVERVDQTLKGSNQTLDRINLESWQGKSYKPNEVEKNPLLAFLTAFVKGLLKFWSE